MGGGNKHKNGIICTFPGCEKAMRTQKFKLHFTKQHLKPGEAYSVEHRRQYEVARDDEYVTDHTIAAAAAAAMKQHAEPQAAVSMPIPRAYQTAAPSVAAALSSLVPPFTAPTGPGSSSSTDSGPDGGESADDKRMMQHYDETAQMEQQIQQRLSSSRSSAASSAPQRLAAQRAAVAAAAAVDAAQRPSPAHDVSSPLCSSSKRSATSALELAAAAATVTAGDAAADPTRAVLIKCIELMDARYHELVQSMRHVIDGQRELIEILRRPVQQQAETTPALEQPLTLGQQIQSHAHVADTNGRKRRKVASANDLHASSSASAASTLL